MKQNQVKIIRYGGTVRVISPYTDAFPPVARTLGGGFDQATKTWSFPAGVADQVNLVCAFIYEEPGALAPHQGNQVPAYCPLRFEQGNIWGFLFRKEPLQYLGAHLNAEQLFVAHLLTQMSDENRREVLVALQNQLKGNTK